MSLLDEDNLPHRVTITKTSYADDGMMGAVESASTKSSNVPAWVQNANSREISDFKRRNLDVSHKVFFATDPGLSVGDKIIVDSGPSFVGEKLTYRFGTDRSAGLGVLSVAWCDQEEDNRAG